MNAPLIASRDDPPVLLRLPKTVLRQVNDAAAKAGRSRNTEIIYRLTESFRPQEPAKSAANDR
jgi:hypothetical protein